MSAGMTCEMTVTFSPEVCSPIRLFCFKGALWTDRDTTDRRMDGQRDRKTDGHSGLFIHMDFDIFWLFDSVCATAIVRVLAGHKYARTTRQF